MSLAAQESVLFELLFDHDFREHFVRDGCAALAGRGLEEQECLDFMTIRPEALILDASMRAGFILSQFCRSYPLSFSLVSSLPQGIFQLRQMIDARIMRRAPLDRLVMFGSRLKDVVENSSLESSHERVHMSSILEAEIGMAWTSSALKKNVMQGVQIAEGTVPADWVQQPVGLAPFVSAAVIPSSYANLKQQLCAETGSELWRRLNRQPLTVDERLHVLQVDDPRVLVARAVVSQASRCEPVTEHRTVELSEGFASLLGHVNGTVSVAGILRQLQQAGAGEGLLVSVQEGFRQLAHQGMLVFVAGR
jgi:hypothetical protein